MFEGSRKGSIIQSNIVVLIVSLISLVLLLVFIGGYMKDAKYEASVVGCSTFFSGVDGKPAFFNSSLDDFNERFIDGAASVCMSKDVVVTSGNIKPAVSLVEDCWKKGGYGEDFMGANVRDKGVCLYCGRIKSKDDIGNFKELFGKEFENSKYDYLRSNDTGVVNLNGYFLSSVPNEVSKDRSITVFYYVYKPEYPKEEDINFGTFLADTVGVAISKSFGSLGSGASVANYILSPSIVDSYGGVVLTSQVNYDEDDFESVRNSIDLRGCQVIVPKENYEG